jgi:hypothetical protein
MEWLGMHGALVWIPLGHSPDVDLIAELDGRLLRVQVKTTTMRVVTPDGHARWSLSIATNGGNQSWTGLYKTLDPSAVDYVFALAGDGRRWFIPAPALEATRAISLGGPKYSEFEIQPGTPIMRLIYGGHEGGSRIDADRTGECPSGQRERTVNAPATPTQVRILPPPSSPPAPVIDPPGPTSRARAPITTGRTRIWGKRRITIPLAPFGASGLRIGDALRADSVGEGRLVLTKID